MRDPEFDRSDGTRAGPTAEVQQLEAGRLLIGLRDPDEEPETAGDGVLIGCHEFEAAEPAAAQTSSERLNV